MNMDATQEKAFYAASVMASRKEQAIKAAIDFYFQGSPWDETTIEEKAGMNIDADGAETFFINSVDLIRFGPLQSNIIIEDEKVMCTYTQPILELY